ncbi:hypothetical protein TruAng_005229 [Truncatella angustata]|nr:hypothetical protein TruAng_005229 [Truncatella angustata]
MSSSEVKHEKVAIITGSTSGIGLDLAKHLHRRGYKVAITGRRVDVGQKIASVVDSSGDTALFVQCNIESYSSQANLFRVVWEKWGRLDVIIANAGIVDRGSVYNFGRRSAAVEDIPDEPDLTCTDVDWKGVVYGTVLATHFMRHNKTPGGKIIVTGSMIGVHPCPTFPEYCSVKAAALQWTRVMAPLLLKKEKITINIVLPGAVDTPVMPDLPVAFLPEHLTVKSCLLSAYDEFLNDGTNQKTGQAVETAHDKLFFYEIPEFKGGEIIAVTGATGSQGGGVVNVMRKTPGWQVRAITRNPKSEAAQQLTDQGVGVVSASFDDEDSLRKAFEGVSAIFAVTNWWEHLFRGKSQDESGEIEEEQGMRIARAAAQVPTLEHYIWSTCPSAKRMFNGELLTPHMDYKANVDARIKAELPELAKKTTYLYFGYYPQNFAFFPLLKPFEYPGTGQYIQIVPAKPDSKILLSGDMTVNPGIWVRQVLATAPKSFEKYANVALEKWTFQNMVEVWSEITGKPARYIECTLEDWTKIWGPAGNELALQFKFGERCDPWVETDEHISPEDLGIARDEVVGFRGTIEGLKHLF